MGGHKAIDKLDAKVLSSHLKYSLLTMLLFQLWKYVDKMEFFHKAGPTVTKTQTGVVRLDHQMTLLCKKKLNLQLIIFHLKDQLHGLPGQNELCPDVPWPQAVT